MAAPLEDVGETAVGAALMRARETARSDRIIDDPYAAAFVAAAPPIFADGPTDSPEIEELAAAFQTAVAVRTRFHDDHLLAACAAGCRQVVLLGAGLDARAFRLPWPTDVRLFEVDLPGVLAFKQRVLDDAGARSRCERVPVPVDLRVDWSSRLVAAGFDATRPVAWTAEGLLAYLDDADVVELLTRIDDTSIPGSRLTFENASLDDDADFARAREALVAQGLDDLWAGGLDADPAALLRARGWTVAVHTGADLAHRLGRSGASGVYVAAAR